MSAHTATARGSARSPSPSSTSLTWIRVSNADACTAFIGEEAGFDIRQVFYPPEGGLPEGCFLPTGALVLDFGKGPYIDGLLSDARLAYHSGAFVVLGPGGPDHSVRALEAGADDYMPSVAHPREVFARLKAVLRSRSRAPVSPEPINAIGSWTFDKAARTLFSEDGVTERLNDTETCLVRIFLDTPNVILSAESVAERLTNLRAVSFERKSIAVLINGLRRKLGKEQRRLVTLRTLGFILKL